MTKKMGVVVTTISDGRFLEKFKSSALRAADSLSITFYVIGDLNTPVSCKMFCEAQQEKYFSCRYASPDWQETFLKKIAFPSSLIPYRSDNRRNIGFLWALDQECEIILSIDDDNFPIDDHYFLRHAITGDTISGALTASDNRWFNPLCLMKNFAGNGLQTQVYPRGFPYKKKWTDNSRPEWPKTASGKVAVNVGLWTGDPDIDAVTRLATACRTTSGDWKDRDFIILQQNQLMPVNTQNTCLIREAMVSYYFVRMGAKINQMTMDRFGDIFSGYFLLLCTRAMGDLITIGHPLVNQVRNDHDLFKDLQVEIPGMMMIEELTEFLEEPLPPAKSYADAYECLGEKLRSFVSCKSRTGFWTKEHLNFVKETTDSMEAWRRSCGIINGNKFS